MLADNEWTMDTPWKNSVNIDMRQSNKKTEKTVSIIYWIIVNRIISFDFFFNNKFCIEAFWNSYKKYFDHSIYLYLLIFQLSLPNEKKTN